MAILFFVILDNENPTISDLPDDITHNTDSELSTAVVTWTEPTATDNSGSVTLSSSHNSGDTFSIGNTMVTYTATDGASNTVVAMFTVEIEGMLAEIKGMLTEPFLIDQSLFKKITTLVIGQYPELNNGDLSHQNLSVVCRQLHVSLFIID